MIVCSHISSLIIVSIQPKIKIIMDVNHDVYEK